MRQRRPVDLRMLLLAVWVTITLVPSAPAGDLYVTRFEQRRKLVYHPRPEVSVNPTRSDNASPFSRWNPFRLGAGSQSVQRTRWVPTWIEETVPVPERIAAQERKETHWIALGEKRAQPSWVSAIDRPPTPTIKTRTIATRDATRFGGVQQIEDDQPRIGMKLR